MGPNKKQGQAGRRQQVAKLSGITRPTNDFPAFPGLSGPLTEPEPAPLAHRFDVFPGVSDQ